MNLKIITADERLSGGCAKTKLDCLREDNCFLADIPDTIRIPALGQCQDEVSKPIETASIDDIAFAQLALQTRASAL